MFLFEGVTALTGQLERDDGIGDTDVEASEAVALGMAKTIASALAASL